jgi:hypothetical protein
MIWKEHEPEAITRSVKSAIFSALANGTDLTRAVSAIVARELAAIIGTSGTTKARVTVVTTTVASAAINGVLQSGCDLAPATQGLIIPILRGTRLVGAEVLAAITRTAKIAILRVAESGSDLENAATGLIRGAIQGANEIGIDTADAAAAAATGALNAVGDVRSGAYKTVLATVTKPFDGITITPTEPAVSSN